jgi:hypothetical protein
MTSDAQTRDLLYVSHRDGRVYAYAFSAGNLQGRLTDVQAGGLCSDRNGDVFIPERNQIREYAHGGTRPIAVFRNTFGTVFHFCAVDPASGDLAVSGSADPKFGVVIYTGAKASPKIYGGGRRSGGYWSCTYDNQGNLFVASRAANLVELPKGGKQFINITWSGKRPRQLGSIQWDGEHLAAESTQNDSGSTTVFRYSVTVRRARFAGETRFTGAGRPLQFWIHGRKIVVLNQGLHGLDSAIMFYGYPAGGSPTGAIKDAGEPQAVTVSLATTPKVAVTTYHYDNLRTGWNNSESSLTYKSVKSRFGLLHAVTLDDQVDAQPLVVPDETTTRGVAPGKHDVVYVATENDTVYAIDASSGTVLFDQNLGHPVPKPLNCVNNGPNVGITGTPVIDRAANAMYVIAYTLQGSLPTYTIHELNLANLTDSVTPVVVSASHKLIGSASYTFNATYERQRPALLESGGNIYAGFGSICDYEASQSRGWLLGWHAGSLAALPANELTDILATSPDSFFLSAIWMSGYGMAADPSGNVYFITGNSDPSGTSYNSVTNLSESAVKVSPDLTAILSFFTPFDVAWLDVKDKDFGSGGLLLLPTQSVVPLAAAAGKQGTLYLLDQNNLGGFTRGGPNNDLAEVPVGQCWCGESYFDAASDSVPRIVASGGHNVTVWKVQTSPSITLSSAGSSQSVPGGHDPGFFTTVSSAGSSAGAIIWALARPQSVPGNITLFAFESEPARRSGTLETLFQAPAGPWASKFANANLIPVIANGKVYVAAYKQLDIFGIGGRLAKAVSIPAAAFAPTAGAPHEVTGTLITVTGRLLSLRTRAGKIAVIDDSDAVRRERSSVLVVGEPFNASGRYDAAGVLHAVVIIRAKPSETTWPPDR